MMDEKEEIILRVGKRYIKLLTNIYFVLLLSKHLYNEKIFLFTKSLAFRQKSINFLQI